MSTVEKEIDLLNKEEERLLKNLEQEEQEEKEVNDKIDFITDSIMASSNGKVRFSLDNRSYELATYINDKYVSLIVIDIAKFNIVGSTKYIPSTATSVYNHGFSKKGNIKAAVEAWVKHKLGIITVDSKDEENAFVNTKEI